MSGTKNWHGRKLLDALAVTEGCRTIAELAEETGLEAKQVSTTCRILKRRQMVAQHKPGCYRLTAIGQVARQAAAEPARSGPQRRLTGRRKPNAKTTFRDRLWRFLRLNPKATISRLVRLAGEGRPKQEAANAHAYLRVLKRAGVIVEMRQRAEANSPTSNGEKRWLIVTDLGPRAPVWRPAKRELFDPNSGQNIAMPVVAHD